MLIDRIARSGWRSIAPVLVFFVGLVAVIESFSADEPADSVPASRIWPDNLFGVDFVDPETGWISGYAGTILKTVDGGDSWDLIYIGRNELIRRIRFVDADYGWAVGHRGSIFKSVDGGLSWQIKHSEAGIYLRDVDFVDRQTGWVVGHDGKILHTKDGGETWSGQQLSGYKGRDIPRLHGVDAIDEDTAILVGEFGVIGRTYDAGATWTLVPNRSKTTLLAVAKT
jgi:photosystem II stability/assembly factor-like uncharacterized protein